MTVQEMLARRNRILETLDVETAMADLRSEGYSPSREATLIALHKARYDCCHIADALRHESAEWLRERNCKRMDMSPLLPKGVLPQ